MKKIIMAIINLFIILTVMGLAMAESINENLERSIESKDSNEFIDSQELFEYNEFLQASPDCVTGCPRVLDPICAVDDTNLKIYKYFHNQCIMDYDNCRQSKAWKPTQMLLCIADVDPLLRADCMRACPLIYNPVCASDGKNYEIFGNQCIFAIEKCLTSSKWLAVRAEQCGL